MMTTSLITAAAPFCDWSLGKNEAVPTQRTEEGVISSTFDAVRRIRPPTRSGFSQLGNQ